MRHVGVFALQAGIEPSPFALESEVLTIGLPGKSQINFQEELYRSTFEEPQAHFGKNYSPNILYI